MTDKPLVSIIIPLYNSQSFVADAIHSCLSQTYKHIEIIVVNDGSSDNSLEVARSFQVPNLEVIDQENWGASAARNAGLRNAKGKYIQFLDADDILSKNKIEIQVDSLKGNDKKKIAYCPTVHFFSEENYLEKKPPKCDRLPNPHLKSPVNFLIDMWGGYKKDGFMVQPNAWLTPKILIDRAGPWNESLSLDDDGEFFTRVLINSEEIIFDTQATNFYRKFKSSNNLSARKSEKAYESLLDAAISKKTVLLANSSSFHAKVAIYRMFIEIAIFTYIEFPQLYKKAISELPKIKYPYNLVIGGKKITKIMSKIFGWRLARIAQHYVQQKLALKNHG